MGAPGASLLGTWDATAAGTAVGAPGLDSETGDLEACPAALSQPASAATPSSPQPAASRIMNRRLRLIAFTFPESF